jgi:hypothetical protein
MKKKSKTKSSGVSRTKTKSETIDQKFDQGEDVLDHFDLDDTQRPNMSHRINLELPNWMLTQLDIEAARLGVPRQAIIKFILDEKLKKAT